ncbi:MAG: type II secretion system F family protein [Candidatus Babeliaceae bacterium]|jgi:type IV pilus assembly protein PilC
MPYYKWSGISLTGTTIKGRLFARTIEHLTAHLLQREIALIKASITVRHRFFGDTKTHIATFYRHLASLLMSGIRLHDALLITVSTCNHSYLKSVIEDCACAIQEGIPLSKAFAYHDGLFSDFACTMVQAGEESGNLKGALGSLALYAEYEQKFLKSIYNSLLMPSITFIFFCLIFFIIFIGVIPRFESLFMSFDKKLPWLTTTVFSISHGLRSWYGLLCLVIFTGVAYGIYIVSRLSHYKDTLDRIVLITPILGVCVRTVSVAFFLQTLAVLVKGGVRLVDAVVIASKPISNRVLRSELEAVARDITSGVAMSDALMHQQYINSCELEALCKIGESTGTLAVMIEQAAQLYRERVHKSLTFFTTILQPSLLIILGLLVGLLLVAVYVPLLTLSHSLG